MRAVGELLLLSAAIAACGRPRPLVICHNANCVGDRAPSRADRLDGLSAALALERAGRPVIDGVELDLVDDAPRRRCVFAHDPDSADQIAAEAATRAIVAWRATNATPFTVWLDLKPTVTPAALAACALAQVTELERAGVTVRVGSNDPEVLRALAVAAGRDLDLAAGFNTPPPFGDSPRLADFADVALDAVVLHPRWTTGAGIAAVRDAGLELTLWSTVLTIETFDAIERFEPAAVTTGDVELLRAWIER